MFQTLDSGCYTGFERDVDYIVCLSQAWLKSIPHCSVIETDITGTSIVNITIAFLEFSRTSNSFNAINWSQGQLANGEIRSTTVIYWTRDADLQCSYTSCSEYHFVNAISITFTYRTAVVLYRRFIRANADLRKFTNGLTRLQTHVRTKQNIFYELLLRSVRTRSFVIFLIPSTTYWPWIIVLSKYSPKA